VHPIHTESVASIVGRAEVLSGLFFLICIITYLRVLEHPGEMQLSRLLACAGYATVAMLCKEQGVTALGVALAMEVLTIVGHRLRGKKTVPHLPVRMSRLGITGCLTLVVLYIRC